MPDRSTLDCVLVCGKMGFDVSLLSLLRTVNFNTLSQLPSFLHDTCRMLCVHCLCSCPRVCSMTNVLISLDESETWSRHKVCLSGTSWAHIGRLLCWSCPWTIVIPVDQRTKTNAMSKPIVGSLIVDKVMCSAV